MITERTKAILLLTSYFAKSSDSNLKPLTTSEWNRLVRWLQTKLINPEDFFTQDIDSLLNGWQDKSITIERVNSLLERKSGLAIALDKWVKVGIWIINRGDKLYPKKVKDRLKENAPPIFFGIGNIDLLNQNYIGVVGARKTSEKELQDTKNIGTRISENNYGIVSGGAKGVDESAMLGALEAGGYSLGFVADSLIRKSTSNIFRKHIINKRLCLVSPFNPEAGFNVGNAMSRNKLIYTQSDATIVMKSDTKGGTWEGAKENIKKQWVPLWVMNCKEKGNEEIIKMGAKKLLLEKELNISELIKVESLKSIEPDLFSPTNKVSIHENVKEDKENLETK
ncbi:MAG: DNA-processing protein DprA [Nanoarchaeota archaeon]|jgi:predicted Rossmann fold nucleotide-binding protein DprA/Smf involved in DNA uptake|nr:DNA-processing protein DprA [Nanoarchaeota archaeon]